MEGQPKDFDKLPLIGEGWDSSVYLFNDKVLKVYFDTGDVAGEIVTLEQVLAYRAMQNNAAESLQMNPVNLNYQFAGLTIVNVSINPIIDVGYREVIERGSIRQKIVSQSRFVDGPSLFECASGRNWLNKTKNPFWFKGLYKFLDSQLVEREDWLGLLNNTQSILRTIDARVMLDMSNIKLGPLIEDKGTFFVNLVVTDLVSNLDLMEY